MPIPDPDIRRVERFCDAQVPPRHRDQVRVECEVSPRYLTIVERHPGATGSEWITTPSARLHYTAKTGLWSLYCIDGNSRWHRYPFAAPSPRVEVLLREIDQDPTGIFWG
jgi:hypothetical protein